MGQKIHINTAKIQIQVFTLLSIAYYLLNIIFPTDYATDADNSARIYPQIAAIILSVYSLFISALSYKMILRNRLMRGFLVYFLLSLIYILFPMRPAKNAAFILRVEMAIPILFALYSMIIRSKNDKIILKRIYIILLFQLAFCFYTLVSDKLFFLSSSTLKDFDSNAGFLLITCIPLVLLFPIKKARLYLYLALILGSVYSGQRSAALTALVSLPLCLWYLKDEISKYDIAIILILGALIIVPLMRVAVDNFQIRNQMDADRGYIGSGRSVFWLIIINDFFQNGYLHIFFGNGTNTVADLLERSYGLAIGAHNGWLDALYSYGFVGFVLYANLFLQMLRRNKGTSLRHPEYKNMYLILFLIFFVKASTSHGYFDVSAIPYLTTVAIIEGERRRAALILTKQEKMHSNE